MNYTTIPQHLTTNAQRRGSAPPWQRRKTLCAQRWRTDGTNGKGSRQWTGNEWMDLGGTRNHDTYRPTHDILRRSRLRVFKGWVCVCVFTCFVYTVHPRWLAGFLPSKQPDFEICFPWCLTHSNSLGEVSWFTCSTWHNWGGLPKLNRKKKTRRFSKTVMAGGVV